MTPKHPSSDPIRTAKRKSVAERRVGIGVACACGEKRPKALIARSNPMICEECNRRKQDRTIYDDHHVAGKANHPFTIPVLANDHRAVLSEAQYDWPKATRENPNGSPLLSVAGRIRGFCDMILYLVKELLLSIPEFLENLDASLISRFGPALWSSLEFPGLPSRRS